MTTDIFMSLQPLCNSIGHSYPVQRRTHYPSGIACAFAARVEPFCCRGLKVLTPDDPERSRSAALNAYQGGLGCYEAAHLPVEINDTVLEGGCDDVREQTGKFSLYDAWPVGGCQRPSRTFSQKRSDLLGRSLIAAIAKLKGGCFKSSLEADSCQRRSAFEIFSPDSGDKGAVSPSAPPPEVAHAVSYHAARL